MAITLDASSSKYVNNAASLTQAHTCSGTDRVLVVVVNGLDATDLMASGTVTYGGVSMGAAVLVQSHSANHCRMYVMANPPAGTANIVVTPSANAYLNMAAVSFTGVDQATPVSASNSSWKQYSVDPTSDTITVSAGGVALDALIQYLLTGSLTCDASQTSIVTSTNAFGRLGLSYKADATAMAWHPLPTNNNATHLLVALKPAAGANAAPTFPGPNIGNQTGTVGTALSANTVSDSFSDTDALTFSAIGTWPPGVTVSSAGIISGTPTTAGTYSTLQVRATDTAAQTVDSDVFSFTISAASHLITAANSQQVNTASSGSVSSGSGATITMPALKDWGTGNLKANETGITIIVNNMTTGDLVVKLTGETSDGSGVVAFTNAALVAATNYRVTTILADGSEGTWIYTAA